MKPEDFAVEVITKKSKNSIKQEAGKAKAMNLKPWRDALKVTTNKRKNSIKKETGKANAVYLKPWQDALKQARVNLGITGQVFAKKDSEYYNEAKKILGENI